MLFNTLLVIVLSVSGEYYCEAENGIGTDISPPKGPDVQYPPKSVSVSVSPSGEIVEGSSVTLTCSSDANPPVQRYTWYKNNRALPSQTISGQKYTIKEVNSGDAGEYYCEAQNAIGTDRSPHINLKVLCLKVDINSDTVSGGETVELTCRATCTRLGNSFIWYKNEQRLPDYYRFSQSNIKFTAKSEDTGRYSCVVNDDQSLVSPAVTLSVRCVMIEITSIKVSEGMRVTLTCKITCTDLTGSQTFIWYNNGQFLQNTKKKYQQDDYLQFKASSGNTGSYSCAVRGHENLPSPAVTLYSPKSTSVSVPPSGEIVEGRLVTLTCSSDANPPVHRYTWYKNNRAVSSETGGPEDSYTIKNITLQDAGKYTCQAGNGIGTNRSPPKHLYVKYRPKSVSVSVRSSGKIVEGSSVTLTCSSNANPPVQKYTWYTNNRAVSSERGGPEDSYTIKSVTLQDAGEYYCQAQNAIGTERSPPKHLDVQYPPKSVSVSVSPSGEIVEGSSVTLTCNSSDVNPPVQNYTWYKNNRAVSSETRGPEDSYTIKNITLQDAGEYYCEAGNAIGRKRSPPKHLDVQSALQVTVQGGQSLIAVAAVGVAEILALVFLCVCLRRRKSTNETEGDRQGNKSPIDDNFSEMAMSHTGTQGHQPHP